MNHKPPECLLSCLLLTAACLLLGAGPSDTQPDALFDVRPDPELFSVRTDAANHYAAALKNLDELEKLAGVPKWVVVRPKIGQADLDLLKADRDAVRLVTWGEPAGADLQLRLNLAHDRLGSLVEKLKTFPEIKNRSHDEFLGLRGVIQRIPKISFNKVVSFEKAGKWEEADAALFDMRAPLEPATLWQSYSLLELDMRPFDQEQKKIRDQLEAQWKKAAAAKLAALAKQATPDFAALAAQTTAAVQSVRASGQATVGGKQLSAPQALWELAVAARHAQAGVIRARALDWARLSGDEQARADISQLEAAHGQMLASLREQWPALIEADAARLQGAEVAQRYTEWIAAAGLVLSETSDADLRTALASSLEHLAARSPELQTSVAQYRQATGDLLRWRERVVQSYIRFHSADAQTLEKRFISGAGKSGNSRGLIPSNSSDSSVVELLDPPPLTVPILAQHTIGAATIIHDVQAPLGSNGAVPLASAYRARLFAELTAAPDARAAAAALNEELAPAGTYPLTLEAAEALAAAARGSYDSVGGKLTAVELLGLMPRFATADAQDPLVRLEPLPHETVSRSELELCVRFTLEPAWCATRYFVVTKQ